MNVAKGVLVIISTAEKDKALAGMMYAANALKYKWLDDVRVFLFGPVEKLVTEDGDLQAAMAKIGEYQAPVACKALSDRQGFSGALENMGYKVDYVGSMISAHIDEGYVPMVF